VAALLYTTTEAVRSAIGLDDNDVPDSVLVDQDLALQIKVELETWLTSHATVKSEGEAQGATAEQIRLWEWLQLYCLWWGAYLLASAPYAVPLLHHDGKSQVRRFNVDSERVAEHAAAQAAKYRRLLEEELSLNVAKPLPILSKSKPSYDPVTGR